MTTALTEWLAVARRIYPDAEICDECRGCGQAHTVDGRCSGCRGAGFVPQRPSWMAEWQGIEDPFETPMGVSGDGETLILHPWSPGDTCGTSPDDASDHDHTER